jgi:hypothetical protein
VNARYDLLGFLRLIEKATRTSVFLLFACASSAFGQLSWENPEQTFNAKPDEQFIVAKYRFTNNSKGPVRIEEVKTSCDCTMAVLTKTEYAPDESGKSKSSFLLVAVSAGR